MSIENPKRALFFILVAITLVLVFSHIWGGNQHEDSNRFHLSEEWSTPNAFQVPESVLYDKTRNMLYVSNINGNPRIKNGLGFISKVSLSGEIVYLEWVTGLDAPKGMGIQGDRLFVTNIDELVEIDVKSGVIRNRIQDEDAQFLNDVAVDSRGYVYVSDMSDENSVIYTYYEGLLEVWLQTDQISNPNGLFILNDKLIVGTNNGYLMEVDIHTKTVNTIAETGFGVDGVQAFKDGFLITDWYGVTAYVTPHGETVEILRTQSNAADIEYIQENSLLLIPTFTDNRVVAYEVDYKDDSH